ncbi:spore cortex biosynthesis protein YabQ [Candidatus Arthromitus sp. SFB-turkey]|uniref:spore cortex biosynthesis protein YabQ n=1 Tax=Candidatus Arthromitus sp. SFB-turkey TaxID=1840217 RepID=UPI0007F4CC03|nr:spore cortex biosynthesis protein YabQ [Candidatus Arthromitus sp. SFB-turkey]OAT89937.1 spore cortex biosynthesis protein YabQ [Candidatus Arthromitus sp. SFB-turkey]HJC99644.1 spore cortex biosynthesis protein YabQ [Candidatus Dwaynia gallinarum]
MINLGIQVLILLYSFLSGIVFGISFDVYRILVGNSKKNFFNFIKCSIFWIIIGIIVFCFLLYTQYAILSFYTYFYIFLGVVFYLKFISKNIFLKVKILINGILTVFRIIFKNMCYTFLRIFNKKINKSL